MRTTAHFRVDPKVPHVSDEGMALCPDDEMEDSRAGLVDRDGFLVFTGTDPFAAVEVIMAARKSN